MHCRSAARVRAPFREGSSNAPDEESHNRDPHAKVEILERIDREIVQPLVSYLDDKFAGNYRIALLPDHYTFCRDGQHSDKLVPYLVYG